MRQLRIQGRGDGYYGCNDITDCDMTENKKENKMNKFKRLREAFEDASFDIVDRFVAQARKVVNNIADNISGIYADEEMSPHHDAWR